MISAFWLLLIFPAFALGMLIAALCAMAKENDVPDRR